jgi:hypothetical protein
MLILRLLMVCYQPIWLLLFLIIVQILFAFINNFINLSANSSSSKHLKLYQQTIGTVDLHSTNLLLKQLSPLKSLQRFIFLQIISSQIPSLKLTFSNMTFVSGDIFMCLYIQHYLFVGNIQLDNKVK